MPTVEKFTRRRPTLAYHRSRPPFTAFGLGPDPRPEPEPEPDEEPTP